MAAKASEVSASVGGNESDNNEGTDDSAVVTETSDGAKEVEQ